MKKILRRVAVSVTVLLLLIIGIYFFAASNFGAQKVLLPILRMSLDAEIHAENCEISLFGENTFAARGFAFEKDGTAIAVKEILLQARPVAFLFGSPLVVENLSLTGLTVNADAALSAQDAAPKEPTATKTQNAEADTGGSGDAGLKYEIKSVSISDGKITYRDNAGRQIALDGINLDVKGVRPGAEMNLTCEAFAAVTAPDFSVARAESSLAVRVNVPEKFGPPPSAAMQFSFGETRVAAGGFSVPDVTVKLALDTALNDRRYEIKKAVLHVGSQSAGDILDLRFAGSADAAWRNGDLNGRLNVYSTPLTDALLSGMGHAKVEGFAVAGKVDAALRDGKVKSRSEMKISARRIAVQSPEGNGNFVSPAGLLTAEVSGDPAECDLTLDRVRLDLECDRQNLVACSLEKPWHFLQRGALQITECPQVDLHADALPMRLFNPWVKGEWKDETVQFKVRSAAARGGSALVFDGRTSFPVGTEHCSGLLNAGFTLGVKGKEWFVSDGCVKIDAPRKAVKAVFSGTYDAGRNVFQTSCEWDIQNPAAALDMPQLSDRTELKPVIRASGAFDRVRQSVRFQVRFSEKQYCAELGGTLFLPENAYQLQNGTLLLQVDGVECGKLSAQGTIPKDGDGSKLDLILTTQTPLSGRGLALKTPEKLDWERTTLNLTAEVHDWKAAGKFSADTRWNEKPLHGDGSWDMNFKDFMIQEAEVAVKFNSGKNKLADIRLEGKFPEFRVASSGVDVRKIQALFEGKDAAVAVEKNPVEANAAENGNGKTETPVPPQSEPDALDLSALQGLKVAMDFRNITYTGDLNLDFSGLLSVKDNVVRFTDGRIAINRAPAALNATLDVGQSGGWHYSVKGDVSALDVAPVARALRDGRNPGFGGTLQNFNLELSGQGFSSYDLMKRSRGKADFRAGKLRVSLAEQSNDALLMMLIIPVQALPGVVSYFPEFAATETGKTLTKYAQALEPVLSGETAFAVDEFTGRISIDRGSLQVEKVVASGGTIKRETISGKAELPAGALDLQSEMLLDDLEIPLAVRGTLAAPRPDWAKTIQKLGGNTLQNALKPENLEKTVKDVKSIIELFR